MLGRLPNTSIKVPTFGIELREANVSNNANIWEPAPGNLNLIVNVCNVVIRYWHGSSKVLKMTDNFMQMSFQRNTA